MAGSSQRNVLIPITGFAGIVNPFVPTIRKTNSWFSLSNSYAPTVSMPAPLIHRAVLVMAFLAFICFLFFDGSFQSRLATMSNICGLDASL